jgi:hypothetical protein
MGRRTVYRRIKNPRNLCRRAALAGPRWISETTHAVVSYYSMWQLHFKKKVAHTILMKYGCMVILRSGLMVTVTRLKRLACVYGLFIISQQVVLVALVKIG